MNDYLFYNVYKHSMYILWERNILCQLILKKYKKNKCKKFVKLIIINFTIY